MTYDETYSRVYDTFLPEPLSGKGRNMTADCPFCEAENKFSVDVQTGQAQCLHARCSVKCNHRSFLTKFHDAWLSHTSDEDYEALSEARDISVSTLKKAKLAYDSYSDRWLIPYKNPFSTHLTNLGHFMARGRNAFRIYKCPNVKDSLPLTFYNPYQKISRPVTDTLWLAEGEWDALALLDLVAGISDKEKPIIMGVPGALIFPEHCHKWFEKIKHVDLFFDNDEAGTLGKQKASTILHRWQKSVAAVDWTEVPDAPDDFDIRDMLIHRRETALTELKGALCNVELDEDEKELSAGYVASLNNISEITEFDRYLDLYGEYLHLSEENRKAIALTMAISTCQYMHGEPLWFFLVGQAGCGKTTLIESYGGNNEYFDYASRITAKSLVSGWNSGNGETSLLPRMNGKTFFIKDFTVVLGMPKEQRREVFNLFRDIYDGTLNITFGNGKVCDFHNIRFNLVAGVTDAIKQHNDASMGERFLRLDYMGYDADDVAIIDSALSGFGQTNNRKVALTEATLGYVKTLVDPANRWNVENLPLLSESTRESISALARYTAHIRTRPEHDRTDGLKYRPRKEVASRLALQFAKLGFALEKVFNPLMKVGKEIDFSDRTMEHIAKVAHDSAEGFNQEIIRLLNRTPKLGRKDIESKLGLPSTRIHRVITDLKTIGLIKFITRVNDKSRNRDPKGRPSEYYSVHDKFAPVVDQVFKGEAQ